MHRLKLFGFAFMAVCALGVMTAMAGASAAELPEFTGTPGVLHETSGKGALSLEGSSVGCAADKALFALYPSSKDLGTFDINFSTCEQKKEACWGLTDTLASKEILVTGSWHLVPAVGEPHHVLILLLLTPVHIECDDPEDTLILVTGQILGLMTPYGKATKKFETAFEVTGTHQKYTKYENDSGAEVTAELKGSLNGGTERGAADSSSENKSETEEVTELTK